MNKIYVIGSGPTLDFIDVCFFGGETVIAVNEVGERLGLYNNNKIDVHTFSHYHPETFVLAEQYPKHKFHLPLGDRGFAGEPSERPANATFYPHHATKFDWDPETRWPHNGIMVGSTGVHGAMHLACKMGAEFIVLVGVDCGILDGKFNHSNYQSGNLVNDDTSNWLARWDMHLRQVKDVLTREYGVSIYSMNPFVNLNLEGHKWTKPVLASRGLCRTCGFHCADLHG